MRAVKDVMGSSVRKKYVIGSPIEGFELYPDRYYRHIGLPKAKTLVALVAKLGHAADRPTP